MPPKSSSDKSPYKGKLKLDLERLKNGEVQATKVDLAKINIRTLAKIIGVKLRCTNLYAFIQFKEILCFR